MAQYATTTINSATPAVDLMTWLDTQLTDNGWTFVETWTSSTKVANVYKSPLASNSVGTDFYLATYRATTTSTTVPILLFEDWDAVNKKARKYAPANGNGITVNVADNTVTDATGVLLDSATLFRAATVPVRVSISTDYISDITVNRLIVGSTNYAQPAAYAGVYDTVLTTAQDPVPLIASNFGGDGSNTQAVGWASSTREPGAPAPSQYNFCGQFFYLTTTTARLYAYGVPYPSASGFANVLASGGDGYRGYVAAPIAFNSSRFVVSSTQSGVRGAYQGVVTSMRGGVIGDTLTVTMPDTSVRSYTLVQAASTTYAHVFIRTA